MQHHNSSRRRGSMPMVLSALSLSIVALAHSCTAEPAKAAVMKRAATTFTCHRPHALDGDTIRCATHKGKGAPTVKVRLLGIDAPELDGHCRKGRVCAKGDPRVSMDMLATLLTQPPVTVQDVGRDRYGRTLGIVRTGPNRQNVACPLIASGSVEYKPKWDNGRRVAKDCGLARNAKGGAA